MRTLLLLLLSTSLFSAVPGVPEPPAPGPIPQWWLSWFNDWHSIPTTHSDDHRTNSMVIGIRSDDWIFKLDDAMLTSRELGVRNDELTATLGMIVANDESATLVYGGGIRLRGNLGGESIQNWWHRHWNDFPVHLEYEGGNPSPVLYMMNHVRGAEFNGHVLEVWWDGEILSDSLASDVGFLDRVSLFGSTRSFIWLGPVWQFREDWQDNQIGREVARFERGPWLDYGIKLGHFSLGMQRAIGRSEGRGTLSWSTDF